MIPNPIRRVLSTLRSHRVRFLLMGGQACVFYGAAEFSRDTDILLLAETKNLDWLRRALDELEAERIAVPALTLACLRKGHGVHFRCRHPDASGIRIDLLAVLRGMPPFRRLWERRTTVAMADGGTVDLLSLPDLVRAKKTQRDKDWPMLRRLVEADYAQRGKRPNRRQVRFWLREARTASLLVELAKRFPREAAQAMAGRPLLRYAREGNEDMLERALEEEAKTERLRDGEYWRPLIEELERIRHRETARRHRVRARNSGARHLGG